MVFMMSLSKTMVTRTPMIVILGATGTGKTKLGVELARHLNSEIISADSMQLYKGLDILTAKATQEEQQLAKHHIVDILEPHQTFTVVDFRNRALSIISNLLSENKAPIVVGGTAYYIESIMWNILVETKDSDDILMCEISKKRKDAENEVEARKLPKIEEGTCVVGNSDDLVKFFHSEEKYTNVEVHEKLRSIDPARADALHVNNRRKIVRSIEVFLETGRRHSEILKEQEISEGKLRRPGNTIVFWMKCEQKIHDERLNKRIDKMLADGLLDELSAFHETYNKHRLQDGKPADYTKGVFQTLGFKCFHPYLMLSADERNSVKGQSLLKRCIADMKRSTIRYSKLQNKIIRNRFIDHATRELPPVYTLDVTDLSKWKEEVEEKSVAIINSHLEEKPCEYEPVKPSQKAEQKKTLNKFSNNICEICERTFIGDEQYKLHLASNRHKRVVEQKKSESKTSQE